MKRQFVALLLTSLVSGRLAADTIVWTNKTGGSYSTATCWNPNQVPKAGDLAELRATTAYKITLNGPATNHSLHVYDGQPTIDLAGFDYRLTNSLITTAKTVGFWVEKGYLKITNSAATPAVFGSNDTFGVALYQPWNAPVGTVEFCGPTTRAKLRSLRVNGSSPSNIPKHVFRVTGGARVALEPGSQSSGGDIRLAGSGTSLSMQSIFLSGTGTGAGVGTTEVADGAALSLTVNLEIGRPGRAYVTVKDAGSTLTAGAIVLATADTGTYGSLTVTNGGTVTVSGTIWGPNTGSRDCDMVVAGSNSTAQAQDLYLSGSSRTATFLNNPFRLQITDRGLLRITRYTTIWTNGLVRLDNAKLFNSTSGVINRGRLEGRGRLERHNASGTVLWDNYGTIQPGLTNWVFGTLVFTNCNLTLRGSSTLRFDIGGTGSDGYSRIAVHGAVTLGGTCKVRLAPGYEPKHADTFQLIAANSFSGGFAARDLPNIAPASWDIDELDTAGKLVVYGPPRETILLVR
jgi:T5SS/PEP-CTERM-associated repeat protein